MNSTSNATDNAAFRAAANAWWVRLDSDMASTEERAEFAHWLAADPQHNQTKFGRKIRDFWSQT